MIDVLLVLLIIFMAAVPTCESRSTCSCRIPTLRRFHTDLRRSSSRSRPTATTRSTSRVVAHDALAAQIHAIFDKRPEKILFVKGDGHLRYADVVEAMDVARGAGIKVAGVARTVMRDDGMMNGAGADRRPPRSCVEAA